MTTVWTAEPGDLAMSFASWLEDGTYVLEVTVEDGGSNAVASAQVTLEVGADQYYGT